MQKLSAKDILNLKGCRKITKVTALDYFNARAVEQAGIDIIGLDGPPIEIFFKGSEDGRRTDLNELILNLKAVRRGAHNTFLVVPIPYGYSNISHKETLATTIKLMKEGADAVKIEGAGINFEKIKKITEQGIPCVGTIGLNIEISTYEGFRCVGKKADEALKTYKDALVLQDLGVVWIEIECMPYMVATEITKRLKIPTIGIGSGTGCDGQFLHSEDILGMHDNYYPKHCKKYLNFFKDSKEAFLKFREDVEKSRFPSESNSFEMMQEEFKLFIEGMH